MSDRQVLKNLLDDFFHEVLDRLEERKVDLLRWIAIGRDVEQDCLVYGNAVFRRVDGVIQRVDPASVKFQVELPPLDERIDYGPQFDEDDEPVRHEGGWVLPDEQMVPPVSGEHCRKCGGEVRPDQYRFGSPATGWEHMAGECVEPHRELTDAEELAEERTWD